MKKILSFFLCFVFLFLCIVPASATEEDDLFRSISVLDYDMPGDSTFTAVNLTSAKPYVMFDLPFSYGLFYYDLVIEARSAPGSVSIRGRSGVTYPLTVKHIEGNYYRCYGSSSSPLDSASFGVQVDFTGSSFYINFAKFHVYTLTDPAVDDLGEMKVNPSANMTQVWQTMGNPGEAIGMNLYNWARDGYQPFDVEFSSVNWRKFDYIDFKMYLNVSTVDSIICQIRGDNSSYSVPFDISWVTGTAMSNNQFIANGEMASQMGQLNASSTFLVTMRLYIPEYARSEGSLIITFNGKYPSSVNGYFVALQNVTGYYVTDIPDPELTKLDQIVNAIESSLSSSSEDNALGDSFTDSVQQENEIILSDKQVIDSLPMPDVGTVGDYGWVDDLWDVAGKAQLVHLITPITEKYAFFAVFSLVATLSLVSYVFFGKKG